MRSRFATILRPVFTPISLDGQRPFDTAPVVTLAVGAALATRGLLFLFLSASFAIDVAWLARRARS